MPSDQANGPIDRRPLVAKIVAAYLQKNSLDGGQLAALILATRSALAQLGSGSDQEPERMPAVPVRRSAVNSHVICLECGWKGKILRRHLVSVHGLTPIAYRARWNLPKTHPIVAIDYSKQRADFARRIGLGSRGRGRPLKKATNQSSPALRRGRGRPRRMPD